MRTAILRLLLLYFLQLWNRPFAVACIYKTSQKYSRGICSSQPADSTQTDSSLETVGQSVRRAAGVPPVSLVRHTANLATLDAAALRPSCRDAVARAATMKIAPSISVERRRPRFLTTPAAAADVRPSPGSLRRIDTVNSVAACSGVWHRPITRKTYAAPVAYVRTYDRPQARAVAEARPRRSSFRPSYRFAGRPGRGGAWPEILRSSMRVLLRRPDTTEESIQTRPPKQTPRPRPQPPRFRGRAPPGAPPLRPMRATLPPCDAWTPPTTIHLRNPTNAQAMQ